ncbi:MAG: outer membrane beta-barrel protein [Gemmatimonadaceae bacterium]
MRKTLVFLAALFAVASTRQAAAQRPLSFELGVFGQYTAFDKDLNLDNAPTLGGRAALYLLKNLSVEGDIQIGKSDWTSATGTKSLTLRPYATRLVYGIPLNDKWKFLVGAGYQNNVFKGRIESINGFVAANEYEDAFTALVGLKYCMNDKWSLRFDVPVVDYDPSPNFNSTSGSTDGKATNYGFRVGLNTMLRGECAGAPFDWTMGVTPGSGSHRPGDKGALSWSAKDNRDKAIAQPKIKNYRWTSSNAAVATVDQSGNFVAVAPGNAEIKLCGMVNKIERCASHQMTVRELNWSTAISPASGNAAFNGTTSFSASATNEDGKPVTGTWTWASSDPSIATVSSSGVVTCVGENGGTATITATLAAAPGRCCPAQSSSATVTCAAKPIPPKAILVVQLTDVHFGFNQSGLSKAGRDTLNWVIKQLTTDPGTNWMVSVEGHTDPYGSDAYNDKLADKRASTVLTYLTKRPGKVAADRVSKASFGERCLRLDDDHDKPVKSKKEHGVNRRVEIWNLNGTQVPSSCRPDSDYRGR